MPYRLLLADDSLTIQKVVELTFPDPDYELLAVGNGNKAMEALEGFRPDIVLADVVMPGPPGYDICEEMRKRPGGAFVPVVLLTGTFEPFDRARADRVGATAVVTKPFDSHALASLVRDLLQKAAEERAAAESAPPAPAEPAPAPESPFVSEPPAEEAAADLFAGEPEPEELYATSAIPVAELAPSLQPPSPPPPPIEIAHHVEPPQPIEEVMELADDEPLPPPPPFEAAPPAAAESAWEIADAPTAAIWTVPTEVTPAVEREEDTQPLPPSSSTPIAFEEEPLEPPPPFEVAPEPVVESMDVHSPTTPTAVIHAAREPEPLEEPPLYMTEPEPPAAFEEAPASEPEPRSAVTAQIPSLGYEAPPPPPLALPEELALPEQAALPPAPEVSVPPPPAPVDEVFGMEAGDETMPAPPPPPPPMAAATPEPSEPAFLDQEEPVARDIDEDIAAFESSGGISNPPPMELEALAASSSLSDLIPATGVEAGAARGLSDAEIEKVARRVAELIGEKVLRDIAWEVVPELAERLVRQRLAEIEKG